MIVLIVRMEAKPDCVDRLIALAADNARQTRREPGNLRFEVLRSPDHPTRFALDEAYRDEAALQAHRKTAHFARWAESVGDLLVAPRVGETFAPVDFSNAANR